MEMTLNMGAFGALDQQELFAVDDGADWGAAAGGALIFTAGAGCLAIACVPGVNVVAAAAVAYAGSWGIAGGVTATMYGLVT